MGFDVVVGPLEGIDTDYEESDAFFDHCLEKFEAINQHLLGLGLPRHDEPRPPLESRGWGWSGRAVIEFSGALCGISEEVEERFDQIAIATLGSLFVPVPLPKPVWLELPDGETFAVGSSAGLLRQCLYVLHLQNHESFYNLADGLELADQQGFESLPDNPDDLRSELATLTLDGCDALSGAAAVSLSEGSSIYIF